MKERERSWTSERWTPPLSFSFPACLQAAGGGGGERERARERVCLRPFSETPLAHRKTPCQRGGRKSSVYRDVFLSTHTPRVSACVMIRVTLVQVFSLNPGACETIRTDHIRTETTLCNKSKKNKTHEKRTSAKCQSEGARVSEQWQWASQTKTEFTSAFCLVGKYIDIDRVYIHSK